MVEYALELILLALVLTVLLLITVVANAHHSIGYVESSNLPVYFIRFCCVKQLQSRQYFRYLVIPDIIL